MPVSTVPALRGHAAGAEAPATPSGALRYLLSLLYLLEVLGLLVTAGALAAAARRAHAGDGRALLAVLVIGTFCAAEGLRAWRGGARLTPGGLATQGAVLVVAMAASLVRPAPGLAGVAVAGSVLVVWGRLSKLQATTPPPPAEAPGAQPNQDAVCPSGARRAWSRVTLAALTGVVILGAMALRPTILIGVLVLAVLFVPIEKCFPLRRRPVLRRHWRTDVVHYLVNGSLLIVGVLAATAVFGTLLRAFVPTGLRGAVSSSPGWSQVVLAFAIATVGGYVGHREAHEVPFLWRFHRVHHSIRELDWLAANHLNPLDETFIRSCAVVPLYALGFGRAALGAYVIVLTLQAIFVHANVRLSVGALRWLFATPQFHHWHHAREPQAYNSNYAGEFPALDLLFGTAHFPAGSWPATYGVAEVEPEGYLRQMAWPFRRACSGGAT